MAEKEYIEREAALKEFEKVCNVCMALVNKPMCGDCSVADTVRKVKSIHAADVRPVVLCRDCKYWKLSKIDPSFHVCTYVCGATFVRNAEDFCSRGEKGEES